MDGKENPHFHPSTDAQILMVSRHWWQHMEGMGQICGEINGGICGERKFSQTDDSSTVWV
jgi:hypothetical protein